MVCVKQNINKIFKFSLYSTFATKVFISLSLLLENFIKELPPLAHPSLPLQPAGFALAASPPVKNYSA